MSTERVVVRPVSPFRIMLLVTLGSTLCAGFTAPGQWAARAVLEPLSPQPVALSPRVLPVATGTASRLGPARRAIRELEQQDGQPRGPHRAPSSEQVSRRLAAIDGWSTAVLFDIASQPRDLLAAGLADAELAVLLAGEGVRPPLLDHDWWTNGPIRTWTLALLDEQGRSVARATLTALRPGFERNESGDSLEPTTAPAPGPGDLPAVSVFHRSATGEVSTG